MVTNHVHLSISAASHKDWVIREISRIDLICSPVYAKLYKPFDHIASLCSVWLLVGTNLLCPLRSLCSGQTGFKRGGKKIIEPSSPRQLIPSLMWLNNGMKFYYKCSIIQYSISAYFPFRGMNLSQPDFKGLSPPMSHKSNPLRIIIISANLLRSPICLE